MSKYGNKGKIIIIYWVLVIIFLLFCSYIRAAWVNFKIIQRKDIGDHKWIIKILYIACGPWTTLSILRKEDKKLSQKDILHNYYQDDLKGGLWFRSENIQFDKILKKLIEKELSLDQRIVLRGYICTDEIGKKRTLTLFSVFIPMLVAAIIGFTAVVISEGNEKGIFDENFAATFITVITLIAVYFFILMHMSNREAKSSIVRTALDAYEELIKIQGTSMVCEDDSFTPTPSKTEQGDHQEDDHS